MTRGRWHGLAAHPIALRGLVLLSSLGAFGVAALLSHDGDPEGAFLAACVGVVLLVVASGGGDDHA